MDAPKEIPRPEEGKLRAFCKRGWGNCDYGWWYVMNSHGTIVTSNTSIFQIAREVNRHNNAETDT